MRQSGCTEVGYDWPAAARRRRLLRLTTASTAAELAMLPAPSTATPTFSTARTVHHRTNSSKRCFLPSPPVVPVIDGHNPIRGITVLYYRPENRFFGRNSPKCRPIWMEFGRNLLLHTVFRQYIKLLSISMAEVSVNLISIAAVLYWNVLYCIQYCYC